MKQRRRSWWIRDTMFNTATHMRADAAATRLGYSKAYVSQILAVAKDIPRYRDDKGVFYNKSDIDAIENMLAESLNDKNTQLERGQLRKLLKGKMNRLAKFRREQIMGSRTVKKPRRQNIKHNPISDQINQQIVVAIDAKTLLELVKSGMPVKFEVKI